jgi:hypothetical protein
LSVEFLKKTICHPTFPGSNPTQIFYFFVFFVSYLNTNFCVNGTQTLFEPSNTGFVWIVTQESLECSKKLDLKIYALIYCSKGYIWPMKDPLSQNPDVLSKKLSLACRKKLCPLFLSDCVIDQFSCFGWRMPLGVESVIGSHQSLKTEFISSEIKN